MLHWRILNIFHFKVLVIFHVKWVFFPMHEISRTFPNSDGDLVCSPLATWVFSWIAHPYFPVDGLVTLGKLYVFVVAGPDPVLPSTWGCRVAIAVSHGAGNILSFIVLYYHL